MKKFALILITIVMLASIAACGNQTEDDNTEDYPSESNQSEINPSQSSPDVNQQADAAYNLDNLIEAVKNAGCISGEPETLDVKDMGAEKGIAYGNIVFLEYNVDTSNAYFDAYDANQVTINGKDVEIGAINGPYFMVFLDGKTDQKAVDAFRSIGF